MEPDPSPFLEIKTMNAHICNPPTHEEIEVCAYYIYVQEGRTEGRATDHWLQAELQLQVRRLVAFLHTGHVPVDQPDWARFDWVARELTGLGAPVDLKQAEEAYFATRVLPKEQYDSLVRLLKVFARHLAGHGNELALREHRSEPLAVRRAREIIDQQFQEEVSLRTIAGMVNVSASHFSEVFKKATGMNFVEYVARVRVEKARNMLQNPNARISEVAFEVGFQSLSQFNRAFKRYSGVTPSAARSM